MTAPNIQSEQNTLLMLRHPRGALPLTFGNEVGDDLVALGQWLQAVGGGVHGGEAWVDIHRGSTNAVPTNALAVVVFATSSGTVGATLNGVAITVAHTGADPASQTLFAAAVRASGNALVQGLLGASNLGATITLASVAVGDYVEIQPIGTNSFGQPVRFTAVASAGVNGPGALGTFSQTGTDTADAAALAAAINAHPRFRNRLYAVSAAAVVTLIQLENSTTVRYRIQKSGATLTLSAAGNFAALASTVVWSLQRGKIGNAQTIAASGTNVSILGSLTRLGGGVGGDSASPTQYMR